MIHGHISPRSALFASEIYHSSVFHRAVECPYVITTIPISLPSVSCNMLQVVMLLSTHKILTYPAG